MKYAIIAVLALVVFLTVAYADSPLFKDDHPTMLAVTVTDFEDFGYGDGHSSWYVYEADIEYVVAGGFTDQQITFALNQTLVLSPVFPAQFVLVIDLNNSELEEALGTKYHAISMIKAEETLCFVIDPAEVFPDYVQFDESVPCPKSDCFNRTCYAAHALLDMDGG